MPRSLSIIIPCYNCEKTLREAVESCFTQGFAQNEYEIILVNDGSTDSTPQLCEALAREHSHIRVIHHTSNRGGGAARNTAALAARAPVIFCLDSDDLLPPTTLNKMRQQLLDHNDDGVCFEFSKRFNGSDPSHIVHIETFATNEPVPFTSLLAVGTLSPVMVVFMFTKRAFSTIGGYPTHHGFDTQGFGWRFLSAGLRVRACPGTSYLHRIHFNESYYLREYNAGKGNFNMQAILLEHLPLFTETAQEFIKNFPCQDFTKDILTELVKIKPLLVTNYKDYFGRLTYPKNPVSHGQMNYVRRDSIQGLWMRLWARCRNLIQKTVYENNRQ
jgi:glycosyltransferase involved in cell wall biosynthesis